ncbi:hypothetical protein E2C01_007494 [Portunus trituberculatus]|uniref:Uncharacterized protein n=1 Tax=Portunus trituberculatus TaxID=210409 RepID=A0A5B7D4D4_PORTR|nr:hypothetical protein [Portunus trituberculatus]
MLHEQFSRCSKYLNHTTVTTSTAHYRHTNTYSIPTSHNRGYSLSTNATTTTQPLTSPQLNTRQPSTNTAAFPPNANTPAPIKYKSDNDAMLLKDWMWRWRVMVCCCLCDEGVVEANKAWQSQGMCVEGMWAERGSKTGGVVKRTRWDMPGTCLSEGRGR